MSDEKKLVIAKKNFSPGDILCKEGEKCPNLYLLLQGAVEITTSGKVVQIIDKEGTFIGDFNPLINHEGTTTLTVIQETECIVVPLYLLEDLILQRPEEGISLLGILAGRLLRKSDYFSEFQNQLTEMMWAEEEEENYLAALRGEEIKKKIVLVAKKEKYTKILNFHFNPIGFKTYYYSKPKEFIENLDSINPDMIIFHSVDFPRHWKPILKLLREKKAPEETVFILITNADFTFEEAAKAAFLRVNGIIPENLLDKTVIYQLNDIMKRYKTIDDKRRFSRLVPKKFEKFDLLFTHPLGNHLVTGSISDISLEGCRFIPSVPSLIEDLEEDMELPDCSLRIGDQIITVNCRISRQGREMGILFKSFIDEGHEKFFKYLMDRAEREIENLKKSDNIIS